MKQVELAAKVLLVVGALNWGLVGLVGLNVVTELLGDGTNLTKLLYILVGASGVYGLVALKEETGKKK